MESPTPGVSRYVPVYTGMYRLVRCYSTSQYILSLKSTYRYILVSVHDVLFGKSTYPGAVHTSTYHNRYISVYTRTYRYIPVHGGSALVHSIVHSSTYGYMRVHPCIWILARYDVVRVRTMSYVHPTTSYVRRTTSDSISYVRHRTYDITYDIARTTSYV